MTDEEILDKAFVKTKNNGFDIFERYDVLSSFELSRHEIRSFIFSHVFAKAFWGEEYYHEDENQLFDGRRSWQYHLQQMVLETKPLNYLEKFL